MFKMYHLMSSDLLSYLHVILRVIFLSDFEIVTIIMKAISLFPLYISNRDISSKMILKSCDIQLLLPTATETLHVYVHTI